MTAAAYVYRAIARDGALLYIGVTKNPDTRIDAHEREGSAWVSHAARVDFTPFATEAEARTAETIAILSEHPRFNIAGRSPLHPDGPIRRRTAVTSEPRRYAQGRSA